MIQRETASTKNAAAWAIGRKWHVRPLNKRKEVGTKKKEYMKAEGEEKGREVIPAGLTKAVLSAGEERDEILMGNDDSLGKTRGA